MIGFVVGLVLMALILSLSMCHHAMIALPLQRYFKILTQRLFGA